MNSIQINKMVIFKFYFIYSIPSLDLFDLRTRRLILLTKHNENSKREYQFTPRTFPQAN